MARRKEAVVGYQLPQGGMIHYYRDCTGLPREKQKMLVGPETYTIPSNRICITCRRRKEEMEHIMATNDAQTGQEASDQADKSGTEGLPFPYSRNPDLGNRRADTTIRGREVRRLRLEKGLTQRQLAEKAGISRGYLSLIESEAVSEVFHETVYALAKALDHEPEAIILINERMLQIPWSRALEVVGKFEADLKLADREEIEMARIFFLAAMDVRKDTLRRLIPENAFNELMREIGEAEKQ